MKAEQCMKSAAPKLKKYKLVNLFLFFLAKCDKWTYKGKKGELIFDRSKQLSKRGVVNQSKIYKP